MLESQLLPDGSGTQELSVEVKSVPASLKQSRAARKFVGLAITVEVVPRPAIVHRLAGSGRCAAFERESAVGSESGAR